MDEHDDGRRTVFVPLAPTPTIGQVRILPGSRVQKIQAPLGMVMNSFTQWGVDSRKFLSREDGGS